MGRRVQTLVPVHPVRVHRPVSQISREREAAAPETDPMPSAASDLAAEMDDRPVTTKSIREWLVTRLSERLGVASQDIDGETPFFSFGMSSVQIVSLATELEQLIGRRLSPTFFYNYPTVMDMSRYLAGETVAKPAPQYRSKQRRAERNEHAIREQIFREVEALSEEEMAAWISKTAEENS